MKIMGFTYFFLCKILRNMLIKCVTEDRGGKYLWFVKEKEGSHRKSVSILASQNAVIWVVWVFFFSILGKAKLNTVRSQLQDLDLTSVD